MELMVFAGCITAAVILFIAGLAGEGQAGLQVALSIAVISVILYLLLGILRLAYTFVTNHVNQNTDEKDND